MATNYEIFSRLQLTLPQALSWGKLMLESGEPWGDVWNTIKERFPSTPDEQIDQALNKEFWYREGAYNTFQKINPEEATRSGGFISSGFPSAETISQPTTGATAGATQPSGASSNRTPSPTDNTVIALFKTYVGRDPSTQELSMFAGTDPANMQTIIKDLGAREQAAVSEAASYPAPKLLPTGTNHLVMFTDDPSAAPGTGTSTVWLFDTKDHNLGGNNYNGTLIPFLSESAFNNFLKGHLTIQQAEEQDYISRVPTSQLADESSPFYNARFVQTKNGITSDGNMPLEESVRWRYGQEINLTHEERAKALLEHVFIPILRDDENFTQDYYDNAFTMRDNLAKYVSALTYGGYSTVDIYRDIIAQNKRAEGDPAFANYSGLSTTKNVFDWKKSDANNDYKLITQGASAIMFPDIKGVKWDANSLDLTLWDIPHTAFQSFISPQDIDLKDPETIAKIEATQTMLSDMAIQMAEADNVRDLAAAQYNWDQLKKDVEKSLNIQLSDNAYDAWNQLEGLKSSMSERGLTNSGIYHKGVDIMMRDRRRADQRTRDAALDHKDSQLRTHLLNNGTVEEMEKFIKERGLDVAREWGLLPDEETLAYFNMENLKTMYPDETEENLQGLIDIMLGQTSDGQFVYRSTLARNHLANMREMEIKRLGDKTQIYLDNREHESEKLAAPYTQGDLFDNITYPEAEGVQAANTPTEATSPAFKQISGEIALKNIFDREIAAGRSPEAAIARTTGLNIYARNLDAERAGMIEYLKNNAAPKNEQDWRKFHDSVYESQAQARPDTQGLEAAADAAGAIADNQTPAANKDFGSTPTTPTNTGFVKESPDSAWEAFKTKHSSKDWTGYEKIASLGDSQYYTDIQNPNEKNTIGGSLYGKRK